MTDFRFDEASHQYFVDGQEWPGFSFLMKESGLVDDSHYNDFGKTRGHAVHAGTALYDKGILDRYTLDPVSVPYIEAYKKFVKDTGFKSDVIEKPMWSPLGFACTVDRIGCMGSERGPLEIKSGSVHWTIKYQTVCQAICNDLEYCPRWVLMLRENGKYLLKSLPIEDFERDKDEFLAIVKWFWLRKTMRWPPAIESRIRPLEPILNAIENWGHMKDPFEEHVNTGEKI